MKFHFIRKNTLMPVYEEYEEELKANPAYVVLDLEHSEVYVTTRDASANGCGPREHYGYLLLFEIPSDSTTESINALFKEKEAIELFNKIVEESYERWNGNNDIMEGTEEREEMIDSLRELISEEVVAYDHHHPKCERAWNKVRRN